MALDIRVVVTGATGKVGREVVAGLSRMEGIAVVGGVSRSATEAPLTLPDGAVIPHTRDLAALLAAVPADVLVDFTNAEYAAAASRLAIERGVRPVIGASGLSAETVADLDARCGIARGIAGVLAPNFAIGAVLMMYLARLCAPFFDYAEIIELHHEQKADAPSGTAIATARQMAAARAKALITPETLKYTVPGSRGAVIDGVTVHSVRLPGQNAHQEIIFGGLGQTLRIRHDALNRESYVPGVAAAVREIGQQPPGLIVGLEQILGIA